MLWALSHFVAYHLPDLPVASDQPKSDLKVFSRSFGGGP